MLYFENMSDDAKVWIYQSNRPLVATEVAQINTQLSAFAQQWAAHGKLLRAEAAVIHDHFIVLMVDENAHQATGCSIDASVHLMKKLEKQYQINLFDRLSIAYYQDKNIQLANRQDFMDSLVKGDVTEDTIVFNNLVATKADFVNKWQVPLCESWHQQLV